MPDEAQSSPRMFMAELTLSAPDWRLHARVPVPAGPTRLGEMLPLARALCDAVVSEAVKAIEQAGEKISCRAGCGACCRHLVAISEPEARRLRAVVEAMPEPRRSQVRGRFAEALRRLDDAGLLRRLRRPERCTDDEYRRLYEAYFRQRIPCPFLEDESCSIYPERPITCREYLVTSSPEHCARPNPPAIRRVRIPLPVFNAVARWRVAPSEHLLERWVPLILALEWAEAHPDDPAPCPGPELLRELLNHLSGKSAPGRH